MSDEKLRRYEHYNQGNSEDRYGEIFKKKRNNNKQTNFKNQKKKLIKFDEDKDKKFDIDKKI